MNNTASISQSGGRGVEYATSRPRVLGWIRSAAILDGDWGTSIAYVLGIGFALAGHSSVWHLAAMLVLTTIVALNYITICRLYPNGGGVYNTVYHRSKTFAVVGALLLSADYVITMSLSILEAFHYFGVDNAEWFAIGALLVIGALNWFGPKHSGGGAGVISAVTLVVLVVIIAYSLPESLTDARVDQPHDTFEANWAIFVGLILSISGIEAISNMTGLMKDPARDSRRAILSVLTKVVLATVFLGLAMYAVPGLTGRTEDMVRLLGEYYVGDWFGWVVAASLGLLLLSAGNTAMNGLVSVQFLMSLDGELPRILRKLNPHGVPIVPLIISIVSPIVVLLFVHDVLALAHFYAVGVVGAVSITVLAVSTDRTLPVRTATRTFMLIAGVVLSLVELSIVLEKHDAALFAFAVLFVGLGARVATKRSQLSGVEAAPAPLVKRARRRRRKAPATRFLIAVRGADERLVNFAIREAKANRAHLFILRVHEIAVGVLPERMTILRNGVEAKIDEWCQNADIDYHFLSIPSYDVGYTIAEQAATLGVERVIIGAEGRNRLENVLKGSVMRSLNKILPEDVQLVIFGG